MILKHTSKVQSVIRVAKGAKPDKTKITKGPETDPGTCGQMVCEKGSMTIEWGQEGSTNGPSKKEWS